MLHFAGICCGPCNPSKWEADIWGWLEVRRSAMLHYTVNQRLHWACQQYGCTGWTWGWLGVKRCQLCLQEKTLCCKVTLASSRGVLCVKCCRMVDSVPGRQLFQSWSIQSDLLLITDWMILAFWVGTFSW